MRTYSKLCEKDPVARQLVDILPTIQNDPLRYRSQMLEIGKHLAVGLIPSLQETKSSDICVISTVEDADFLARGLIDELEVNGFSDRIHFICLWNDKIQNEGVSLSPIVRQYKEEFNTNDVVFVVVKAIISGACVVKTNLTRAISFSEPQKVFVAAPVMLLGAEQRLAREFPSSISSKFEFIHFAIDTEKNGEDVVPGVGGSLYELLGLGNRKEKNKYVPQIVKERRNKAFSKDNQVFA